MDSMASPLAGLSFSVEQNRIWWNGIASQNIFSRHSVKMPNVSEDWIKDRTWQTCSVSLIVGYHDSIDLNKLPILFRASEIQMATR